MIQIIPNTTGEQNLAISAENKFDGYLQISAAEKTLETKRAVAQKRRDQVTDHEAKLIALQLKVKAVEDDLKASNDDEIWNYHQQLIAELIPLETELGPNRRRVEIADEAVVEAEKNLARVKLEDARTRASGRNLIRSCKRDLQHAAELVDELVSTLNRIDRRHYAAQAAWVEVKNMRPDLRTHPDGWHREPSLLEVIGSREMRLVVASAIENRASHDPSDIPGWICKNIVLDAAQPNMPMPENAEFLGDSAKAIQQMIKEEFYD